MRHREGSAACGGGKTQRPARGGDMSPWRPRGYPRKGSPRSTGRRHRASNAPNADDLRTSGRGVQPDLSGDVVATGPAHDRAGAAVTSAFGSV